VYLEHRLLQQVLGARVVARLAHEVTVQPRRNRVIYRRKRRVVPGRVALHGSIGVAARRHGQACIMVAHARTHDEIVRVRQSKRPRARPRDHGQGYAGADASVSSAVSAARGRATEKARVRGSGLEKRREREAVPSHVGWGTRVARWAPSTQAPSKYAE